MALMNTSFNLKGHPVVNTLRQAVEMFQQSGMDVLVIGDFVVQR
jgi:carbamoyltransferase